jgi:hypothetical protein
MIKDGIGGANTQTGLKFEKEVDFLSLLQRVNGYSVQKSNGKAGSDVLFDATLVERVFKKHDFYCFLEENEIDWKAIISKQLLPDDALLVIVRETLFIIEVKYQQVAGSVDEKLQTCDFKRKQYLKLVRPLGLKVEYVYVLNDWFKSPSYKDVLDYIDSVCCHYKFNELPLAWLGLPTGKDNQLQDK